MLLAPFDSEGWRDRIDDAAHVLYHCWDEWEGQAQEEAQQEQRAECHAEFMLDQIRAVLIGMVFDE